MRIIPKKTKVSTEFFKGLSLTDVIVGFVGVLIMAFVLVSNLPFKLYLIIGLLVVLVFLMLRMDDEPVYMFLLHILQHAAYRKSYHRLELEEKRQREADAKAWEKLTPKERKAFIREEKLQEKRRKKEELKEKKKEKKKEKQEKKKEKGRKGSKKEKKQEVPEEQGKGSAEDNTGHHSRKKVSRKEKRAAEKKKAEKKAGRKKRGGKKEAVKDEISKDESEIAESEITENEIAADKTAQDETAEDENVKDETAEDETAEDEIVKDETISSESAEDESVSNGSETNAPVRKKRSRKSRKIEKKQQKKAEKEKLDQEKFSEEAIAAREAAKEKKYRETLLQKEAKKIRTDISDLMPFTGISGGMIEYAGRYYGTVIEIPAVEFRFFSGHRQNQAIDNALGAVLRSLPMKYSANLVKIERPVLYDEYIDAEYNKLHSLEQAYVNGLFTEDELRTRTEVLYDRINYLNTICFDRKVVLPFFYLVLFDSDRNQLEAQTANAKASLETGELSPRRLNDKEIAVFLKYTNGMDFDEREIEDIAPEDYAYYAMPEKLDVKSRTVEVNGMITHNMRVISYPTTVSNAWGAYAFDTPGTKVVMKMKPIDRIKAIRSIDRSIDELRSQENATGKSSKLLELSTHIETLSELLVMLQNDNEALLEVNIYVTAYDLMGTLNSRNILEKPEHSIVPAVSGIKKMVRRIYSESGMKLKDMMYNQMTTYIGSQISAYDPYASKGRDIHSSSVAAVFPFVYSYINDKGGINLGKNNSVPVFIDFFRRDSERVNSNMVIIGKSGSGKSFATKSLLTNLAGENGKIFVLDPENEYTELAHNLGGKIINVGNASQGRLNPFHIITNLEDDEEEHSGEEDTGSGSGNSFGTHLQFLEEFFRQILPDIESDAMEYLNNLIIRVYSLKGIDETTDLSRLTPEDYPIFDDLYDVILEEFQSAKSDYLRANLQILINYVAKFSTGGRNAGLWNGCSTITTEENFIVFNFQSLLSNRNNTVANAQMLLVLKWLDNEIIKNRDYNIKYNENRKIVVVIDEAHVFIDTKYPLALDFMFQLAKRIRKYNGMQIVITQNIKDFVGSEEIARKSTAIINACQYSIIFSLSPNDMHDLCKLYEKAGEINNQEQEQIINARRGQAFVIISPTSRSSLTVDTPEGIRHLFSDKACASRYYAGEEGELRWEEYIQPLRAQRAEQRNMTEDELIFEEIARKLELEERKHRTRNVVQFIDLDEEDEDAGEELEMPVSELDDMEKLVFAPKVSIAEEEMPVPEVSGEEEETLVLELSSEEEVFAPELSSEEETLVPELSSEEEMSVPEVGSTEDMSVPEMNSAEEMPMLELSDAEEYISAPEVNRSESQVPVPEAKSGENSEVPVDTEGWRPTASDSEYSPVRSEAQGQYHTQASPPQPQPAVIPSMEELMEMIRKQVREEVMNELAEKMRSEQKPEKEKPQEETPEKEKLQEETPQKEKLQEETPQEEVPQEETLQEEMTQKEKLQEEVPQEEMPQEEKLQEETPQEETPQEEKPEKETPQKENPQKEKPQEEKKEVIQDYVTAETEVGLDNSGLADIMAALLNRSGEALQEMEKERRNYEKEQEEQARIRKEKAKEEERKRNPVREVTLEELIAMEEPQRPA